MSAKSIASSEKFKAFVLAFSLAATVIYVLSDVFGLPVFTYHPATGRFEWGYALPRRNEGPVMYWYGWIFTMLIGATVAGVLATLLPERISGKIPLALLWILPILAAPVMFWTLMSFWTK